MEPKEEIYEGNERQERVRTEVADEKEKKIKKENGKWKKSGDKNNEEWKNERTRKKKKEGRSRRRLETQMKQIKKKQEAERK